MIFPKSLIPNKTHKKLKKGAPLFSCPRPMATVWIHRAAGPDLLVPIKDAIKAHRWATLYLSTMCANDDFVSPSDDDWPDEIGCTRDLQVSVHRPWFFHRGWAAPNGVAPDSWNHMGSIQVSRAEAYGLGRYHSPSWFIPGESEGLTKKETRSHAELDAELDDYHAEYIALSPISHHASYATEEECTANRQEGICECCGTLTYDY